MFIHTDKRRLLSVMDFDTVKEFIISGKTYEEISEILKTRSSNGDFHGLSARSVRRFCKENQIDKKTLFNRESLDETVQNEVAQVNQKQWICLPL